MILKTKVNEGFTIGSNLKNSGKIFEDKNCSLLFKNYSKIYWKTINFM